MLDNNGNSDIREKLGKKRKSLVLIAVLLWVGYRVTFDNMMYMPGTELMLNHWGEF